jgi:hypothetical protein
MSPTAIVRNIDRVRQLRQHEADAFFAKQETLRVSTKREADDLARKTAAALRASDHWAPNVKETLLSSLERAA